jgi:hypothetical protein
VQQLAELRGAAKGIRDDLVGGKRKGRFDSPISLGDQMRPGWKPTGIELGKPLQVRKIDSGRRAHRGWHLPGSGQLSIEFMTSVSIPVRHNRNYPPDKRSTQDVVVTRSIVIYD